MTKCQIVHELRPLYPDQTSSPMGHHTRCATHGVEFSLSYDDHELCPLGKLEARIKRLENRLNGESWKP